MKAFARISHFFPQVHETKQSIHSNIQAFKAEALLLEYVQYRKHGLYHAPTPLPQPPRPRESRLIIDGSPQLNKVL